MPQMASMEKNDPIDNLVEHLKYKIQRSRQWTKHTYIDSIRKDDLFYNLILFIGPESDHWVCLSLTD